MSTIAIVAIVALVLIVGAAIAILILALMHAKRDEAKEFTGDIFRPKDLR